MSGLFEIIRSDIGDILPTGSGQIYSDSQLNLLVDRALTKINGALETSFELDASGCLAPSGTAKEENVVILCTECIIARREYTIAIRDAIKAKQDENTIDTTAPLTARKSLMNSVCADAAAALNELQRDTVGAGANGEIIWLGTERLFEEVDFDGTGRDIIPNINIDIVLDDEGDITRR